MSLIITSSNKSSNTIQNNIDAPYHYRNDFRSGMTIPANSEIAVESVKINRNPTIDYEAGQDTFFWFGERLESDASYKESLSYIIPSINTLRANLSPSDFASRFEEMIKEAYSLHPEFDTVNGITMTPLHTAASVIHPFQGFRYNINQIGSQPPNVIPPANTEFDVFGTSDWDGTTWTSNGADVYSQIQPSGTEGGPISLHRGILKFDKFTGTGSWVVGLSRPIMNDGGNYQERNEHIPMFPNSPLGNGLGADNDQFYDFAVESKGGVIRCYHSVPMSDGAGQDAMEMREIIYYQDTDTATTADNTVNSSFADGAPIPSASITDITFEITHEKVKISASGNTIVRPHSIANASFKDQVPKPVGQTCWKMYPTAGFYANNDTVDITEYRSRDSKTMKNNIVANTWAFKSFYHADMGTIASATDSLGDFIVKKPWSQNSMSWIYDAEFRELNKRFIAEDGETALTSRNHQLSSFVRDYYGLNASSMDGYEPLFIVNKNDRYISPDEEVWQPNSGNVLGFNPFAVVPLENSITAGGATGGQASFTSTTRPNMSSEHSTFIRVPTLNHQTFNFGTGNPSKILFQVPRFDNGGQETGALYFQNNDKSFVDLKNPTDITVTDLDVQFVRKDETFAKDLTGSSEVVFFVRSKARM